MGAGAFLLGMLADRIGRRPTILGCLAVMGAGMWMASTAGDVTTLSVYRLLTGLGIGGMLATTSAIVAETANARRRNLAVAVMAGGYPVGAVVGGSIASMLLARTGHWQSVFEFGSIMTLAFIPLVLLMVPETTAWLYDKRPANALERINRNMARHGRAALSGLPAPAPRGPRTQFMQFFEHGMAQTTLMLIVIHFGHMMSFYFFIKWIPKVVVDMGFPPAQARGVLVSANVGGALGSLGVSLLTQRFGVRGLVSAAMLASAVAITLFGSWPATLGQLSIMAMGGLFRQCGDCRPLCGDRAVLPLTAARRGHGAGDRHGPGRGGLGSDRRRGADGGGLALCQGGDDNGLGHAGRGAAADEAALSRIAHVRHRAAGRRTAPGPLPRARDG